MSIYCESTDTHPLVDSETVRCEREPGHEDEHFGRIHSIPHWWGDAGEEQ